MQEGQIPWNMIILREPDRCTEKIIYGLLKQLLAEQKKKKMYGISKVLTTLKFEEVEGCSWPDSMPPIKITKLKQKQEKPVPSITVLWLLTWWMVT